MNAILHCIGVLMIQPCAIRLRSHATMVELQVSQFLRQLSHTLLELHTFRMQRLDPKIVDDHHHWDDKVSPKSEEIAQ